MSTTAFSVERGGGVGPVQFDGTLLARVSTVSDAKDRWSELEIYLTKGGQYVTHTVGASRLPGEVDLHSAHVHKTAKDAIRAFVIRRTGKLSGPALDLLDEAAERDQAIARALDEFEEPIHVD